MSGRPSIPIALRRRLTGVVGIAFIAVLLAVVPAAAGDAPPPDEEPDLDAPIPPELADKDLEELRDEIPEGFPGKYDLTEANARYRAYASAYGESTEVADFGDGSELSGPCAGYAYSYDSDGELIDAAMDIGTDDPPFDLLDAGFGQAFTSGNPFKVDTNGVVLYYGSMPEEPPGPYDHRWKIKTSGISLDSGGDPNPNGKNIATGLVDLAEDLPVKFNAKAQVEGEIRPDVGDEVAETSTVGPCFGKGHVEFVATGVTPAQVAGIAALAGGILGLLFNARPAMTFRG